MNESINVYAVDWGHGRKLAIYPAIDGEKPATLLEFLEQLSRGTRVVVESTWESWDKSAKNQTIDRAKVLGIELLTVHPRATELYRRNHKLVKTTDEADAEVIYKIATEVLPSGNTRHLAQPRRADIHPLSNNEKLNVARRLGYPDELIGEFTKYLPEKLPKDVNGIDISNILGNSEGIRLQLVIYALEVVENGGTRKDYDKKVGMYSNGYNNIARSNLYYYRLKALVGAAVKEDRTISDKKFRDYMSDLPYEDAYKLRKKAMKSIRKASRWIFHEVKRRHTELFSSSTGN